jgi:hypothetical protein
VKEIIQVLYTANLSAINKSKVKMKVYHLKESKGNDAVAPDEKDFLRYEAKTLTWKGMKINYLAKLMRKEAEEWMRRVAEEAAIEDVVLVDEQAVLEDSFRKSLAEMMVSMFSSNLRFRYAGEIMI